MGFKNEQAPVEEKLIIFVSSECWKLLNIRLDILSNG